MNNTNNTQPEEDTKEGSAEEKVEEVQEESTEETLGESLVTEAEKPKAEKPKSTKPDTVPFDTFIELKKELQELKKNQSSSVNLTGDSTIDDIAKEYDVDANFVRKLASAVKTSSIQEFEEKYSSKLTELENVSKKDAQDKKFNELYESTMERLPYFKDIVNKEAIKQLAFNPANGKKKLSELMEEVYGSTIQGRKTMETAQPNGGRDEETVNFAEAGNPAVYARIKADPKLRKEYNEYLVKHLNI